MRIKDLDVLFHIKLSSLSLAYFTRRKYLSVITRNRKGLKTVIGDCTVDAEGLGLDSVSSREHGRGGRPGDRVITQSILGGSLSLGCVRLRGTLGQEVVPLLMAPEYLLCATWCHRSWKQPCQWG